MSDGTVGVFDESGSGTKKVDVTELTVGVDTVERQRVVVAGAGDTEVADVKGAPPTSGAMGVVVRPLVGVGAELDGHSETLGATTDAAVDSDTTGTIGGKLRGLVKIFADVWDSVAHKFRVDTGLSQPLTDTQLRASAVPVSAAALPLPSGASTEATLALIKAKTDNLDVAISTRTKPADQQHTIVDTLPSGTVAAATAKTADFDTGAGTDVVSMMGMALPKSGGAVAGGTSTDPLRTDPTGTTAQPVTDNGGSLTVDGSVAIGSALPTGTNLIGQVGKSLIFANSGNVNRSASTTTYTTGDALLTGGAAFTVALGNDRTGVIRGAHLRASNETGGVWPLEMWVFRNVAGPTENAPFNPTDTEVNGTNLIGVIKLPNYSILPANQVMWNNDVYLPFLSNSGQDIIVVVLVLTDSYTPPLGTEVFNYSLLVEAY